MRKKTAFLLTLLCFINATAQEILIPYKKGNLFGLVDENNSMVVQPKYTEIDWLLGKYLMTAASWDITSNLPKYDTKNTVRSLYFGKNEIVSPDYFLGFQVLPEMMISGKYEDLPVSGAGNEALKNKSGSFSLFDWKGNPVLTELKRFNAKN